MQRVPNRRKHANRRQKCRRDQQFVFRLRSHVDISPRRFTVSLSSGGEGGIRTLGSALRHYDGLANRCFRPLSHLSRCLETSAVFCNRNMGNRTSGSHGLPCRLARRARLESNVNNLWSLGGLSWRQLVWRTWHETWEDAVFGQAARLAFYHFLAIFPCLLLLFFALAHAPAAEAQLRDTLTQALQLLLPQQSFTLLTSLIDQLDQTAHMGTAIGSAGLGAAWAAINGTWAVISGLNTAYEVRESRPLWKVIPIAFALTVTLAIIFSIALTVLAYAFRFFPGPAWIVEWPVIALLLLVAFSVFYRFGPNLNDREWQWSTPGATFALVLWLTAVGLMRLYTAHFHSYGIIYKQLNGAATLLLWLYFTSAAVLIGGEMNSEIEKAAKQHERRANGTAPTRLIPA